MVEAKGRILLADDEPGLLRSYGRLLTGAGYDVSMVDDGVQGVDLFKRESFDVVVSDVSMPGLDGLELLRVVHEHDSDAQVVLITAGPSLDTAIRAVEYGAVRYLTKPLERDELLSAVSRAVQLRKMAEIRRQAAEVLQESQKVVDDRSALEAAFNRALETLWMATQPIVRWSNQTIYGYEALLRSGEPALGNPGLVISAAERLGRLPELGRTIRARVAEVMKSLPDGISMFVNLHTQDLEDPELSALTSPLTQMASRVVLELTERASIQRIPNVRSRFDALRELGYRLAIDDLGAGYAGLNSFTSVEPEVVKIDMGLIRGIHASLTKQKIVASLTALCRELEILVVAEGIETVDERDTAIRLGCDLLQGYLFSPPGRPFPEVKWAR
ncbi:MAG: EAL domain-containing protein [Myxococcota bacterium]